MRHSADLAVVKKQVSLGVQKKVGYTMHEKGTNRMCGVYRNKPGGVIMLCQMAHLDVYYCSSYIHEG